MTPTIVRYGIRGLAIAISLVGVAAFAAAPVVTSFTGFGQGVSATAVDSGSNTACADACPSGDTCTCWGITGSGTLSGIGATAFSTTFIETSSEIGDSTCHLGNGTLTLSPTAKKYKNSTLSLNYIGSACLVGLSSTLAGIQFNGSYIINPTASTGKFGPTSTVIGAQGSGLIAGSGLDNTAGTVFGNLNGTILLP
jgi:hypothetical protein